jgi:hypothetical protein
MTIFNKSILPSNLLVALSTKLNLFIIVQRKKSVGGEKSILAGLKNRFPELFCRFAILAL